MRRTVSANSSCLPFSRDVCVHARRAFGVLSVSGAGDVEFLSMPLFLPRQWSRMDRPVVRSLMAEKSVLLVTFRIGRAGSILCFGVVGGGVWFDRAVNVAMGGLFTVFSAHPAAELAADPPSLFGACHCVCVVACGGVEYALGDCCSSLLRFGWSSRENMLGIYGLCWGCGLIDSGVLALGAIHCGSASCAAGQLCRESLYRFFFTSWLTFLSALVMHRWYAEKKIKGQKVAWSVGRDTRNAAPLWLRNTKYKIA